MKTQTTFALGVIALMAACGGGSSGTSLDSFSAVTDEGLAAARRLEALGIADPTSFQRTGSADFSGTVAVNDIEVASEINNATVVGSMIVNVDFANADNVTGTAENFFDLADTPVGGTLELSNVEFAEGDFIGGFEGDLDGQLTNVGVEGQDQTYDYDLDVAAIYFGDGVQALLFDLEGTASEVGDSATTELSGTATLER